MPFLLDENPFVTSGIPLVMSNNPGIPGSKASFLNRLKNNRQFKVANKDYIVAVGYSDMSKYYFKNV